MYVCASDFWFWVFDSFFWTIACGGPDGQYVPAMARRSTAARVSIYT
jgi:hypothetical protein